MKEDNIIRGRDAIDRYCKAKGINLADLSKPEFMEKVMNRYAFKDWDSVLASIGHGGLKEGQVINKMLEEREKKLKRETLTQKFWTALPIQMEEAAKQLYARIRAVSWSRDFMIWQFVSPDVVILYLVMRSLVLLPEEEAFPSTVQTVSM